jgi:uncharacterized membrane protein/nitrite reductase/ring-hydroxylating ferredoxin subunit
MLFVYFSSDQLFNKKDLMKSRANIKGHPLHPILVSFPITLYTGTLVFDVLGFIYSPDFHQTAFYLNVAALFSALFAAIPGIIDFTYTVPPESTGKKRAAKHGMINLAVMIFFGAALYYRLSEQMRPSILLGLEVAGEILLFFAGWMGGTLVYRNQIGVDHRYANAGKWKELYLEASGGEVRIEDMDDLQLNQMRLIHTGGRRIVIARCEEGLVAFDDRCTHRGGSLADGSMICGTVHCPWHGSHFNTKDGSVKAGPAKQGIKTYPLRELNGKFYLKIS